NSSPCLPRSLPPVEDSPWRAVAQLCLVRPESSMNWEMLSAIGQLVAAVGVIPSLIYLAIQIREQNKERRRAGINVLTAQWGDLVKSAQESADFSAVFLDGIRSFHGLDPVGQAQI